MRLLLGYERLGHVALTDLVNALYRGAWLPLRNHFTPVMKLLEKKREEGQPGRWEKTYDEPATPYQRLLTCGEVPEASKERLRQAHVRLDPFGLHEAVEAGLGAVFEALKRLEEGEELAEALPNGDGDRPPSEQGGFAPPSVAPAPGVRPAPLSSEATARKKLAAPASVSFLFGAPRWWNCCKPWA